MCITRASIRLTSQKATETFLSSPSQHWTDRHKLKGTYQTFYVSARDPHIGGGGTANSLCAGHLPSPQAPDICLIGLYIFSPEMVPD